ncbi:hypothetical protein MMC15_000243 [Xylographa vitiligo]|nr:hypothetical protein [Xylographa vitiligo]
MDTETLDLAKEYPYLVTANSMLLSESGSDDEQNYIELEQQYRVEDEVRIRDFAFPEPAMDQINLKTMRSSSAANGSLISEELVTRIADQARTENGTDRNFLGTSQSSWASPDKVPSPEAARHSPLNVLSSSATETILLNAAPPLDYRTMNVIPASRKSSATPSPPPNKPLPPIPEAHNPPQPFLEGSRYTKQEVTAFCSGHEPPIPPKSPRRFKRNTPYTADDKELEALVSLGSPAHPKADHNIDNPDRSGDSGSSSPNRGSDEVVRTHDELLQWRKLRTEKTQARKRRDLEQSSAGHRPIIGMRASEADVADDTDDTIILPVVTSSMRSSAFSPDKTSQSLHDRWSHLKAVTDNKTPLTLMAPCVVPPPSSSQSINTRSLSPPQQRRPPTKVPNSGETSQRTNVTAPVVLQPAPLHTRRNVSILSTTRPLYKHSTQGSLYIPPSPPLSPTAPPSDEDTTSRKLSNRASFAQHRSSRSYATIIEPEAETDAEDFSLYSSETEVQLQAELAVEKKRSAILKAALVAMINASAQFESPPSSEAGNRLSSFSGKSAGSGPLEITLEGMLDSIAGLRQL